MTQRPTILMVDPNVQDLQLLEISLRNMGFAVTTATTSFDALKKVEIFPPDLIISETTLHDFDGFSFCKSIKENKEWARIPFIFLSSDRNLQSKIKGLQLGVDDYLTKPIFLVELVARIRMLMQKMEREQIEKQESKTRFSGSLSEIGLVDIIQTIDISKKRGVVHLAHDGETGAIYFEDGNIVDAELAQAEGEEAIYRMMRWSGGFFDIEFRPIRRERRIQTGIPQLLMEGLRRLDEWNRILEQLPPMDTVFDVDVAELIDRLDEIPDEVNGLTALFDGRRSLKEIVNNDIFSDLDTLRIVSKLIFFGVLVELGQKEQVEVTKKDVEHLVVGAEEKVVVEKAAPMKARVAPLADLQFGKAEEAGVLKGPLEVLGEAQERSAAVTAAPTQRMAPVGAEAASLPRTSKPPVPAAVTAGPAEKGKGAEEETLKVRVAPLLTASATPAVEVAQTVQPAQPGREATPIERESKIDAILSSIDSKIEKLRVREEVVRAQEKVVEEAPVQEEERDAKTAKIFVDKPRQEAGALEEAAATGAAPLTPAPAGGEVSSKEVMEEKKTARWIRPVAFDSGKEGAAIEEEPPVKEMAEGREMVQAISLREVKEEIERREKEEKMLGDSGAFNVEEKEFFKAAPLSEPVDTFDDLVDRKTKSRRGLIYASATVAILAVASVLIYFFGRDYFKQGPDLGLVKKLEQVQPVDLKPLRPVDPSPPIVQGVSPEGGAAAVAEGEGGEKGAVVVKEGGASQEEGMAEKGAASALVTLPQPPVPQPATPAATEGSMDTDVDAGAYAALLREAESLMKARKKKEAIEKYKEAVRINPEGQEALSALIDFYKENPKDPEVLEWGKRATELGPNDTRAWFGYGLAMFIKGKKAEARAVFEQCTKITPADSRVGKCREMLRWVK